MKTIINLVLIILMLGFCTAESSAGWRDDYAMYLDVGKHIILVGETNKESSELVILKGAIFKVIQEYEAPGCEVMKMAINRGYAPYYVLKFIFEAGGGITLDQLCNCATEAGVMKPIIIRAAMEAVDKQGKAVYNIDEITQSQCLLSMSRGVNSLDKEVGTQGYGLWKSFSAMPVGSTRVNNVSTYY